MEKAIEFQKWVTKEVLTAKSQTIQNVDLQYPEYDLQKG